MIKLTLTEKEIKKRILETVKNSIDEYSKKISESLQKRTLFYSIWCLVGLLLIIFKVSDFLFYSLSFCLLASFLCLSFKAIKQLKTAYDFINEFDKQIKKHIEQKLLAIKQESLKNKLGLWLSGQNNQDIEDFCIAYFIRESLQKLKIYKLSIAVRLAAYILVIFICKEMFLRFL